ncbi:MAG: Fe(2+) transporter permease subunit FeoB [Legionellales bacterium]|nr:Fe(2+) transporter permease subunit FeoB [Legionellales bacterium]
MEKITVALIGNPNCGKTTLINALTGSQLRVGNWPGVTVERKSGFFNDGHYQVEVIDLPGTYSLTSASSKSAMDEAIATRFISEDKVDIYINVIEATNLERNLFLTSQLLDTQLPMIIAVTMMDELTQTRQQLDVEKLNQLLNVPVIPVTAIKKQGIQQLKKAIVEYSQAKKSNHHQIAYSPPIENAIQALIPQLNNSFKNYNGNHRIWALRLLEDDQFAKNIISEDLKLALHQQQANIAACEDDADILIADARYEFSHQIANSVLNKEQSKNTNFTTRLDHFVLNRFLGIPLFFAMMYCMFLFAINIGGAFQDFFDISTDTIFVQGFAHLLQSISTPSWLIAILASGAGKGINTTVTFIPVIGGMFLFLSFLESSGYMARAAFVMDRFMRALGLPGKSFVPLIVGFGCNVPAIMAARTLDSKRDRILTIMMSPFMSCGARLAIFAVFTAAFFPRGGQNIVFLLYLIGILMAIFTGLLLRKTVLQGEPAPFILELPPYRLPTVRAVLRQTWARLKRFLIKAGKLIIPICILIGALNSLSVSGHLITGDANQDSLLSALGRFLTPLFHPMGIQDNNWPATVGLITGTLAKEVVIATLNTLYMQVGHLGLASQTHFQFWENLRAALVSIPTNLAQIPHALGNPILAAAPDHSVNPGVYGIMYQRFGGQVGAFAYLLFVLLYIPCISTTAVMARELNKSWTVFSTLWALGLAYGTAVVFYQACTFSHHPFYSFSWLIGIFCGFTVIIFMMRYLAHQKTSLEFNSLMAKG